MRTWIRTHRGTWDICWVSDLLCQWMIYSSNNLFLLDICIKHRKLLYFGGIFALDSWTLIKCENVLDVPGFTVCIVKICWRIVSKMGDRPIRIQDDFETMQRLMNELGTNTLAFMKMGLWMWSINFRYSLIYLFNSSSTDCFGQFYIYVNY